MRQVLGWHIYRINSLILPYSYKILRKVRRPKKKYGVLSVEQKATLRSIVMSLWSTWLMGHLTPYHRLEALGVRSIERMDIDHKIATCCRNMFRPLRTCFVLFVNPWDMMRIIVGLMNSSWKGHKMFM